MTFFALLALAGAFKSFSLGRRPTTNSKCTFGLGLILLGFFILWLAGLFRDMNGRTQISLLIALAAIADMLIGTIMAAIGLSECKRARPPYIQGRKQAITGLVIMGLAILLAIGKYGNNLRDFRKTSSEPQIFEEFNLSYALPPPEWQKLDPKTVNPNALLAYHRRGPEILFMLAAEKGVYSEGVNTQKMVSIAKETLRGIDAKAQFLDGDDIQVSDLTFKTFDTKARVKGKNVVYTHAITTHNGYAYQLVTFALGEKSEMVRASARIMSRPFRLIDPEQMDLGDEGTLVGKHVSRRFGYRLDLSGDPWFTSKDGPEDLPETAFRASLEGRASLLVIPVILGKEDPLFEASLQALLYLNRFSYPKQSLQNRKTINSDAEHEIAFTFDRERDPEKEIVTCRVLQKGGLLYYVAGTYVEGDSEKRLRVEAAVRSFQTIAPERKPDLASLPPDQKQVQALFFNEIGNHFFNQDAMEKAKHYFLLSLAAQPANTDVMGNIVDCYFKLRQNGDALRFLDQQTRHIQKSPDLLAYKAWLLADAGQGDEAIKLYQNLFKEGFEDDFHLSAYLDLLERNRRFEEALAPITRVRKKKDGPLLQARHARLLMAAGRPKDAVQLLENLPDPLHPQARRALIEAYEATQELTNALTVTDSLLTDGYASAHAYHTKARLQKVLGQLKEAKKTTSLGLLHYESDPKLLALASEIEKLLKKN